MCLVKNRRWWNLTATCEKKLHWHYASVNVESTTQALTAWEIQIHSLEDRENGMLNVRTRFKIRLKKGSEQGTRYVLQEQSENAPNGRDGKTPKPQDATTITRKKSLDRAQTQAKNKNCSTEKSGNCQDVYLASKLYKCVSKQSSRVSANAKSGPNAPSSLKWRLEFCILVIAFARDAKNGGLLDVSTMTDPRKIFLRDSIHTHRNARILYCGSTF